MLALFSSSRCSSWSTVLVFALLSYGVCGKATTTIDPTSVDEEDDVEEEVPSTHVPKFVSKPASLSVLPGETATFPCEVDDLGTFATVWTRGENKVIFANTLRVNSDTHYRRLDDRSLQIRKARPSDSGFYYCIISSHPTIELRHTLSVLVAPTITSKAKPHITINKGQPLSLFCEATGTPNPTITWKLLDGVFADGSSIHEGGVLYTAEATRHQAGTYECLASNGIGDPATQTIKVHVNYPPELEPVRSWVHAGEDVTAELTCKVRAHPAASVTWVSPSGNLISDSDLYKLKSGGNGEHSLQIRKMMKEDFGDYVCQATNREGSGSAVITVSGLASPAEFKSNPQGSQPNEFSLKWETHSYNTVIDYLLRIKSEDGDEKWTEVRVPADHQHGLVQSQSYVVTGLEPATSYQAEVIVHNKFGNSRPSRHFVFSTLGASEAPHKDQLLPPQTEAASYAPSQSPAQPQQQTPEEETGNKNGAANQPSISKKLSSLLTVIILSVFFWY